jgi:hypothetical protein
MTKSGLSLMVKLLRRTIVEMLAGVRVAGVSVAQDDSTLAVGDLVVRREHRRIPGAGQHLCCSQDVRATNQSTCVFSPTVHTVLAVGNVIGGATTSLVDAGLATTALATRPRQRRTEESMVSRAVRM